MEQWLPTIISGAMFGLVIFFIRSIVSKLEASVTERVKMATDKTDRLAQRLETDEREYLTRSAHKEICTGNSAQLMLHINKVMEALRKDMDAKNEALWVYLRDLRELIKNGNSKV